MDPHSEHRQGEDHTSVGSQHSVEPSDTSVIVEHCSYPMVEGVAISVPREKNASKQDGRYKTAITSV